MTSCTYPITKIEFDVPRNVALFVFVRTARAEKYVILTNVAFKKVSLEIHFSHPSVFRSQTSEKLKSIVVRDVTVHCHAFQ